uniref:hypothetical protein n=1 Tax=Pedobacter schmidteae TaxID=2201271 RepID=UPI0013CEF6EF|nr:hypothetical protein [Pedobacter schmidteae]
MNPLDKMTLPEKGRLLHQLFPAEMKTFLEFSLEYCRGILEAIQQHKILVTDGNFGTDVQEAQARRTIFVLSRYKKSLLRRPRRFGRLFFDPAIASLNQQILVAYCQSVRLPNEKFRGMVFIIFPL